MSQGDSRACQVDSRGLRRVFRDLEPDLGNFRDLLADFTGLGMSFDGVCWDLKEFQGLFRAV